MAHAGYGSKIRGDIRREIKCRQSLSDTALFSINTKSVVANVFTIASAASALSMINFRQYFKYKRIFGALTT